MKSRIQWCKNFAPGSCLGVTRGQKVGFWVLFFFLIVTQLLLGFLSWTLKLSQVIALWMRTGGMHLEFWCAQRYAMALVRGYAMVRHQLALVKHGLTQTTWTCLVLLLPYWQANTYICTCFCLSTPEYVKTATEWYFFSSSRCCLVVYIYIFSSIHLERSWLQWPASSYLDKWRGK